MVVFSDSPVCDTTQTTEAGLQIIEMAASFTVVGYDWEADDLMTFRLDDGGRVLIMEGNAFQFDANSSSPNPVCTTNMDCARFRIEGVDVADIQVCAMHAMLSCLPPHYPYCCPFLQTPTLTTPRFRRDSAFRRPQARAAPHVRVCCG